MSRSIEPPFWLVWNEKGFPPKFKHTSSYDAEAEAQRLAAAKPGTSFVVLAPTARVTMKSVEFERFDVDAEVPF
ncbi:MAG: hypothetical protein M3Y22_04050 [Pseudomonadota bacterium]|nr:hypothetical protein [Pseudomonadota bacterium]